MIYIKGDLHGEIDMRDLGSTFFLEGRTLTKNDYVIILGDFGAGFDILECLSWLKIQPWTTLFIRGNHDNPEYLYSLPEVKMFNSTVSLLSKDVYWLHDAEVYEIEGKKFFTFGGALSTDKEYRKMGLDWWPLEIPTYSQFNLAQENLDKVNWTVDYVLTHTCPTNIIKEIYEKYMIPEIISREPRYNDPTTKMLDSFQGRLTFSKWLFGHMHEDMYLGVDKNYIACYHRVNRVV